MDFEIQHIVQRVDRIGDRRESYRRDLRRHRLTPPLLLVLRLLESQPGLTMVELSRRLGVSVPTMQSRMQRLEELGLIRRQRSRDDRRKVPTQLTRRGRGMLRRVPLAGTGRLLDALEKGEVTPRRLRRLADELAHVERLLFPEEGREAGSRRSSIWRR
ncbi:MAG TPA: winged helix-turn-helix domain-containing protein [bacterium]|nr:winged helix-turn-helix domain-containing protein [bacterium]